MLRTQIHRPVAVGTPLGEDVLLLKAFDLTEQLSRPFRMELSLLSENHQIPFEAIVGQNVSVRVEQSDGQDRYLNGYVSRFWQEGRLGRLTRYGAEVVPWLWFLTRTADCRIFQAKTAPEVIMDVFREHGFTDFEDRLSSPYRQWEYCVQYRETDFDFVSRLMEQEGIYYYFTHANGKHMLVLADSISSHQPYPGYEQITYFPPSQSITESEHVSDWRIEQRVQPGAYSQSDFDFQVPKKSLRATSRIERPHAGSEFEIYDYPGEYEDFEDGEAYTRIRIEELQAGHEVVRGQADARGISAGYSFLLTNFSRLDQCREYLVTSASVRVDLDNFESAEAGQADFQVNYTCSFTAIDASQPYRPPRQTPRPAIRGPQTAIVVGPAGEEIHTDKYGRVKVQFHWDRCGKADENSSCWIRVSQPWAGKKWGGMWIPRIGQEVVVEFLEGDPDHPIITGRVYNGEAMPPYELPANATMSTLKSNSSKGGDGFNELRFEDKKGKEQIFIHAQRDQDIRVGSNCRETVGNDRHLIVKRDQLEKVEGDKHQIVEGDQNEKVGGTISIQAGADVQEKIGGNLGAEAGTEIHLKAGMNLILEAGATVTLKAGGGFVAVGPAGVTIQGTLVNINSGGAAGSGAGCSPDSPKEADPADTGEPGETDEPPEAPEPVEPVEYSASAEVMKRAAADGTPFAEKCQQ